MIRALIIGDDERKAIGAAVERAAARPISLATIERDSKLVPQGKGNLTLEDRAGVPGRPESEHVYLPGGYRASISFEEQPIGLCRHLSVSVDTAGMLPNMLAVGMIAEAFGFVAGMERQIWVEEFDPGHHAINVVEPVMPAKSETWQ